MAKRASKKETGFVKDFIEHGDATRAIRNNYDITNPTNSSARSLGSLMLKKPRIQAMIADMLPDDLLAEKHLALLHKLDECGEIDVQAVKAGLDMGYKIKGTYAPEKRDVTFDGVVSTKDPKNVALAERYESELKSNL